MRGWLRLHRQLAENPLWLIKPFSEGQAWIDLLMITTYDEGFIKIRNGEIIKLSKGQCGYSQLTLSERWGWSRGKVRRFLNLLKNEKMIQQKNVGNFCIINILNYDKFQNDTTNDTTNGQQTIQQTDTINTVKNVNTEKNIYLLGEKTKTKIFQKPTVEEIKSYCLERKNNIDPNSFFDYYESKGWMIGKNKMKDWKAAIRTWERNHNDYSRDKQEEVPIDYENAPYNPYR